MFDFLGDLFTSFFKSDYSGVADKYLDKCRVRFTQDSIKDETRDGYDLNKVIRQLNNKTIASNNLPVIRCLKKNGKVYSEDNRRLYVFKQATTVQKIPVVWSDWEDFDQDKFTTTNDGKSIRVRSGRGYDAGYGGGYGGGY